MSTPQIAQLIGILVGCVTIFAFILTQMTALATRRKNLTLTLAELQAAAQHHKEWEAQQAVISKQILLLCFNIGNEMVKCGANGGLKRAVDDLSETIVGCAVHDPHSN